MNTKLCAIVLGLAAMAPAAASADSSCPRLPLAGKPNPDARAIRVRSGAIEVSPSSSTQLVAHPLAGASPYAADVFALNVAGEPTQVTADVRNLQWAVQNAGCGGTVRLTAGTFEFGAVGGVYLPGVNLVGAGVDAAGNPRSVIHGGRSPLRISFNCARDEVRIDGLWLRGASGRAVFSGLTGYQSLQFTHNHVSEVTPLFEDITPIGSGTVTRGLWVDGDRTGGDQSRCRINDIVVRDNRFDSISSPTITFYDTAVQVQFCETRTLKVKDNAFRVQGGAVELNFADLKDTEIVVRDNSVEMESRVPGSFNTAFALLPTGGQRVTIADNDIYGHPVDPTSSAIGFWLSHATAGADYVVRGNTVDMTSGFAAVAMGFPSVPLAGGLIADNVFKGNYSLVVAAFDLSFAGGAVYHNESNGNVFRDNDFTGVTSYACHVFFDTGVHDNRFIANEGLHHHEDGHLDCDFNGTSTAVDARE